MTFLSKCLRIWGVMRDANGNIQFENQLTLRDITPGHPVRVSGFSSRISSEKRTLLRAYGVVPGYQVRVLQQSPVSVVQVDHTEIALEPDLATEIFIIKD